ncbi:hypothetical protein CCH79_00020671 [Gambusia affinis]|uniref:C-type lectin domain-containing protein n=1 Tax=Gambusia affinis TaxID=33528 RepID=A0A315WGD8_GAMAF|nr:hypothetical protein CCH79_00020671 [Gambusia affinis]
MKCTAYFGLFSDTWRWSDGSNSSFRHWNKKFSNVEYNSGQCALTVFDDEGKMRTVLEGNPSSAMMAIYLLFVRNFTARYLCLKHINF